MSKLSKIKQTVLEHKYIFASSAIIYLSIYVLIIKYVALVDLPNFFGIFGLAYSVTSFSLAVFISVLIGLNFALFANKIKDVKLKQGSTAGVGVFSALLATGCPSCAIGIFPLFASLFGISASLGSLPLRGIELQLLSVGLLSASVFLLSKEEKACKAR